MEEIPSSFLLYILYKIKIIFAIFQAICERFFCKNIVIMKTIYSNGGEVYQGGETMKYEKPDFEVVLLKQLDIITLSYEESGDSDGTEGPWS